jgi:hypothetical protein
MVSNHRLVLFTHALCRLSYPAVNEGLTVTGGQTVVAVTSPDQFTDFGAIHGSKMLKKSLGVGRYA